jgi:hypothetical protein
MREMVAPSTNTSLTWLFSCFRAERVNQRTVLRRALSPLVLATCAVTAGPAIASVESAAQAQGLSSINQPAPATSPPSSGPLIETAQIQTVDSAPKAEDTAVKSDDSAPKADDNGPKAEDTVAQDNNTAPAENSEPKSEDTAAQTAKVTTADENAPLNTMLLLEGVAKYGLFGRGTDLLESDQANDFDEKFSVGYFGAQATFGLMPANSAFTLAGRLRAGAYLGHSPAMGNIGAAMLFGANFARKNGGRSFSYAMGGLGVEFIPTYNADLITVHASGGTVFNEFTLGAGLDFGINNELFIATFGLQLGWGRLL